MGREGGGRKTPDFGEYLFKRSMGSFETMIE
jgi:hypothetical protein